MLREDSGDYIPREGEIMRRKARSRENIYVPVTGTTKIVITCNAGENRGPSAVRYLNEMVRDYAVCLLGGFSGLQNFLDRVHANAEEDKLYQEIHGISRDEFYQKLFHEKTGLSQKNYYTKILVPGKQMFFLLSDKEIDHHTRHGNIEVVNDFIKSLTGSNPIYHPKEDDGEIDEHFLVDLLPQTF